MKQYVTYGLGNKFYPEHLDIVPEDCLGKPRSAWWGSPVDAAYGWREYCISNEYVPASVPISKYFSDDNKILWTLREGSRILNIKCEKDLWRAMEFGYIKKYVHLGYPHAEFNYSNLLRAGYIAIELYDPTLGHGNCSDYAFESMMYSWDCESIAVLVPAAIVVV